MRLFLTGLAAISLLAAPMAGCKKDAPAPVAGAAAEAGAKPAGEAVADAAPAGGAEKPAEAAPVVEAAPGAADPAAAPVAEIPGEPADPSAALAALAAAGGGADDAKIEAGIKLMEEFGTIMGTNKEDCDKLAEELKPFIANKGEEMKSFNETMEKASKEVQDGVRIKYAARMEKTMGEIMAAGMACGENEKVKAVMASMTDEGAPEGDE